MNKFNEAIGHLFAGLSGREKKLVAVALCAVVLVFTAGLLYFGGNWMDKRESRVKSARASLEQIKSLESEYRAAEKRDKQSASRLEKNPISFFSLLENTATKFGLKLNELNERTVPVKDADILETSADVNFKQVSIDRLSAFIKEIEGDSSGGLVKVKKLKVKTRYDNGELLDVNMTVATWKPAPPPS